MSLYHYYTLNQKFQNSKNSKCFSEVDFNTVWTHESPERTPTPPSVHAPHPPPPWSHDYPSTSLVPLPPSSSPPSSPQEEAAALCIPDKNLHTGAEGGGGERGGGREGGGGGGGGGEGGDRGGGVQGQPNGTLTIAAISLC